MSVLAFDAIVTSLRDQGVPLHMAEATARRECGVQQPTAEQHRQASIREKEEQAAIVKLFREHGFTVRSTSQARASKIAIGFYDLFVTHKTLPIAFFFDAKRQVGAVWSEAQQEFERDCRRCGIEAHHGDQFDAQAVLDSHNVRRAL